MIKSMTGFGRYEYREGQVTAEAEIKSVNHRYCDVYVKLPRNLNYFEDKVKRLIAGYVSRGKMDVYLSYLNEGDDSKEVIIDEALIDAYYRALDKISKKYNLENDVSPYILGRFPDALKVEKAEEDEASIWAVLEACLINAINQLVEMRLIEGEKLSNDILDKLTSMEAYIKNISEQAPLVVDEYKQKLENRIRDLMGQNQVDEIRLATEVAIFADKCSIDEELVRLSSHISQLRDILKQDDPVGRKLDFLIQEMNREVNTIGSKANNLEITKNVVELKSELEKIREQVQNLE